MEYGQKPQILGAQERELEPYSMYGESWRDACNDVGGAFGRILL